MLAMLARFATRRTSIAALTAARCRIGRCCTSVAAAQQRSDSDFSWDGRITSGNWLYVRDLNGSIRVERATGDRAEVTAVKRSPTRQPRGRSHRDATTRWR